MKTIEQILDAKGSDVWSITPDATVLEAIKLMADKEVGALLVVTGEKTVGIVSERDYAREVILKGRSSRETPIKDIMTTHVVHASPDQIIEECMVLMTEKRIRHLPIMDGERLRGMLSMRDLLKAVVDEQKLVITELERYIGG